MSYQPYTERDAQFLFGDVNSKTFGFGLEEALNDISTDGVLWQIQLLSPRSAAMTVKIPLAELLCRVEDLFLGGK